MAEQPTARVQAGEESRRQMLRLVTRSFCKEILDYGVSPRELVRVSGHVLEFVTSRADRPHLRTEGPFEQFRIERIRASGPAYEMDGVSLDPLSEKHLPLLKEWVAREDIRNSMLVAYPTDMEDLWSHMAGPDRSYHVVGFRGEPAGLIGAEEIDRHSMRLEMRKLIGEPGLRGRGIGTRATFVWLHHVFDILEFNKVYIHTHDTNVRNINLNRSLGFELEGVLSQERLLRGRYVDILRMGLLRKSWIDSTRYASRADDASREDEDEVDEDEVDEEEVVEEVKEEDETLGSHRP